MTPQQRSRLRDLAALPPLPTHAARLVARLDGERPDYEPHPTEAFWLDTLWELYCRPHAPEPAGAAP